MKPWPEWNDVEEELPECDGNYEVTSMPMTGGEGVAEYDGHGFLHQGTYRPIPFWRIIKPKEKKYGKVK